MIKWFSAAVWGLLAVVMGGAAVPVASAQSVRVEVADALQSVANGKKGRVVVFLIAPTAKIRPRADPIDGFFEENPQPIFGIDTANLSAGVELTPDTEGFLGEPGGHQVARGKLKDLPPGEYRLQAAWIASFGDVGSWEGTAGNLFSEPVKAQLAPGKQITLTLVNTTADRAFPKDAVGAEEFAIRSDLLSKFYGRDITIRAGVRFPRNFRPGRKYPVVYEVPGFGGDHASAARPSRNPQARELEENAFHIVLDPSSPTGHSLFLDSDNNGPRGKALTEELIPALEAKFPLVTTKQGRLLRGHSSGGWSTLWLATEYPEVFGACWSSSPDPVDFRQFELVDIYARDNHYTENGAETASARMGGNEPTMSVRQENTMEDVLSPGLTSAQQWTSWQACWGRRAEDGGIRPLYDVVTGKLDKDEAESYRRFDITDRLRKDPKRFVPLFRNNVRLIVGTRDDYYLEKAVELLAADLEKLDPKGEIPGGGYIKFVPMTTHSTVFGSAEIRGIPKEMTDYLAKAGLMGK